MIGNTGGGEIQLGKDLKLKGPREIQILVEGVSPRQAHL